MSKGHGVSGYTHTQRQLDDYANQHNPNNQAYWDNLNNHSNQCNPNNDEYWHSRENDEDDEFKTTSELVVCSYPKRV